MQDNSLLKPRLSRDHRIPSSGTGREVERHLEIKTKLKIIVISIFFINDQTLLDANPVITNSISEVLLSSSKNLQIVAFIHIEYKIVEVKYQFSLIFGIAIIAKTIMAFFCK